MSQAPERSGQATDSNFVDPASFARQRFQESPTELEQPSHIPIVEADGYYPAINGIDPDRRALVIGAEQARFANKVSKDTPKPTKDEDEEEPREKIDPRTHIQIIVWGGERHVRFNPDEEANALGHLRAALNIQRRLRNSKRR